MKKIFFVSGFLASGKTTFINSILADSSAKIAVIVNEFGLVDVDSALINNAVEIKSLSNGSVFCSCKADKLVDAVSILCANDDVESIVVECSGLANPSSLNSVLQLLSSVEYGGIISLVDCVKIEKLINTCEAVVNQIRYADLVLLTKVDLVDDEQVAKVKKLIKKLNDTADIKKCDYGKVKIEYFDEIKVANHTTDLIYGDAYNSKYSIDISRLDINQLTALCRELSEYCLRLKGFINDNASGVKYFEYIDNKLIVKCVNANSDGTLIALSVGETKGKINAILAKYNLQ